MSKICVKIANVQYGLTTSGQLSIFMLRRHDMMLDRTTFRSIAVIALMLVAAAMAATWASGQTGTIPTDLTPGEIVVVVDRPGQFVGITDKESDNSGIVRTVVLDRAGQLVAQTWSDDGSKVMEAIDAFVTENGDDRLLPAFALSAYAPTIVSEILAEIEAGTRTANSDGSYNLSSNEVDVICLNDNGAWTGVEVADTKITATRVESIINPGTYVDLSISIDFKSGQHGVCAVFVCRDSFDNVGVQPRVDVTPATEPTTGGVSADS